MKNIKALRMILLTALLIAFSAFAVVAYGDLGSYEPGTIGSIDGGLSGIESGLGSYEPGEIGSIDGGLSDIESGLSGYETHEIDSIDGGLSDIDVSLSGYETHEIESVDVSLSDIEVNLSGYETHEIADIDVTLPEALYPNVVDYMGGTLTGLSDLEVEEIVTKRHSLIYDLHQAFADAGILVNIDPITGRMTIDANLLYATNEYKVTESGKAILKKVFQIYCSVLSREEYRGFVSQVVIIGHTDTDGSYDYNVTLSRNRAEAVMAFCLSDECGVENADWLASHISAEGHSYDELIYNADGTENKAASRRVEIGFSVNTGLE